MTFPSYTESKLFFVSQITPHVTENFVMITLQYIFLRNQALPVTLGCVCKFGVVLGE